MSSSERRSPANAIWLCNACGRLVDNDEATYSVELLVKWKDEAIDRARRALESGGRSTTAGLFATYLDLQRRAVDEQRAAQQAALRSEEHREFRQAYAAFLSAAKDYAGAINRYGRFMEAAGYDADREMRAAGQQPISLARAGLERAHQAVLLLDVDDCRRQLRWTVVRGRLWEAAPDTNKPTGVRSRAALRASRSVERDRGASRQRSQAPWPQRSGCRTGRLVPGADSR